MSAFLSVTETDLPAIDFVRQHGRVDREFSHLTQDSGNVSWLAESDGQRFFVKTAGPDGPPPPGAPTPYFDHAGRVRLLRNAADVARSSRHPAIPELLNVIESADGPLLVYEAVPGDLIGVTSTPGSPVGSHRLRQEPTSAYQRFARLPGENLLAIFDVLIDLHRDLAEAGWVASDLYDGCLIVDFSTSTLHVVDLDNYRPGPSVNDMGRMFGAKRFMAPEELQLGASIDQRTTVFNLGRLVWHFCTRLSEQADEFCGPDDLAAVVSRATHPDPAQRHPDVATFASAWLSRRNGAAPPDSNPLPYVP